MAPPAAAPPGILKKTDSSLALESTPLRTPDPRPIPREAPALNAIRFFAAVHIVIFHNCEDDGTQRWIFFDWGRCWVSFFLLLSGFGPAHSRLSRQRGFSSATENLLPGASLQTRCCTRMSLLLPTGKTLFRRLLSVYPIYLVGMGWVLACRMGMQDWPFPNAVNFLLELFLVADWIPASARCSILVWIDPDSPIASTCEGLLAGNQQYGAAYSTNAILNWPTWYVSCLAFFWLFETAFFELAAAAARRGSLGFVEGLGGIVLWMLVWPYAGLPEVWNKFPLVSGLQRIEPLCFVHHYFAGVLLAFFIHHRAAIGAPPLLCGFASTIGTLAMILVFMIDGGVNPYTHEQFGTLLPIFALMIIGMVEGDDPMCSLLNIPPLPRMGTELSYAMYVLQMPVCQTLGGFGILERSPFYAPMHSEHMTLALRWTVYMTFLIVASALAFYLVQKPVELLMKCLFPSLLGGK